VPQRSPTSGDDLSAALVTFAIFSWELIVALLIDPLLADTTQYGLWHHLITAAGWTIGALLLTGHAEHVGLLTGQRRVITPLTAGPIRAILVVGAIIVAVAVRAVAFGELKIAGELATAVARGGLDALAAGLGLAVYYFSEAFLIVLLVLFGQRAGQNRFGRPDLPWGGLVLGLTWGVMHFFLQGTSAGFYAMFAAVLYGVVVLFGPRSIWAVWFLVAIAFIV
jgi:hypothetical protein